MHGALGWINFYARFLCRVEDEQVDLTAELSTSSENMVELNKTICSCEMGLICTQAVSQRRR